MDETSDIKPQVSAAHYFDSYDTKERFISYWTQIHIVRELSPTSVLEVGVGNGLVNDYLKRCGVDVTSVDVATDLFPDVVASVHSMPFSDNVFETVMACQVLEHLPFDLFPAALSEIRRVASRYAVISLPDASRAYSVSVNLPKIGRRGRLFDLSRFARRKKFQPDEEHYWEIGWKGYSLQGIISAMKQAQFTMIDEHRVLEFPYHHFFVLEKNDSRGA